MKSSVSFLTALAISLFSLSVQAQKQFTDGSLVYNISISSEKNEASIGNASSLDGATLTLYLNPSQSRTEMNSTLGVETTVYNSKKSLGFILKEYSGQKLMITLDGGNWSDKNKLYENLKFIISNDLVDVAGYKCKKATAQLPNGKMFTVYFNPDIVLSNKTYNSSFPQLNGLPIQYEIQSGNLSFKYTLNAMNGENISTSKFEAPKSGFRVMSYEETQQLKKN